MLLGELSDEERKPLTPRQERFVEEYLIDLNATQAAIRAGYSPASAGQQACDLLKLPKVRARIDIAVAERSKRTGVNADRVLLELAKLALANPLDVVEALDATIKDGATREDTAAIQSIKVKTIPQKDGDPIIEREVRMYDKNKSLELLGKHLGMFIDKKEISGPGGEALVVKLEGEVAKWAK
ncbi:MAG TPA: terminase small subunit [Firmicutes bacterium]|nr:terminase small subunit [Candidatus Fermentithermobacillaceae bacterium]